MHGINIAISNAILEPFDEISTRTDGKRLKDVLVGFNASGRSARSDDG